MSRRRLAALALALAVTGCGVQPTGVVDAGEPARGQMPGGTDSTTPNASDVGPRVFFIFEGNVLPTVQAGLPTGDADVALTALLKGPSVADQRKGMYTELPRDLTGLRLGQRTVSSITVFIGTDVGRLSKLAMLQITCTVEFVLPDRLPVLLAGTDGSAIEATPCVAPLPSPIEVSPS